MQFLNGLTLGSVYALVAVGYTLVFGVLGLINFAHGSIYTLGSFFAYTLLVRAGVPFLPSFLLAMLLTALAAVLIERVAYYPLRKSTIDCQIISVYGVAIMLDNVMMLVWGAMPKGMPPMFTGAIYIGELKVSLAQMAILGTGLILMAALWVLTYRTRLGTAMRACSMDQDVTWLMGVNVDLLKLGTFCLSAALAAAAGTLVASYYGVVSFNSGLGVLIKAFVVAIIGGIGSLPGSLVAGFLVGMMETLTVAYVSTGYKDVVVFALLMVMLVFRPTGLMGKRNEQKA